MRCAASSLDTNVLVCTAGQSNGRLCSPGQRPAGQWAWLLPDGQGLPPWSPGWAQTLTLWSPLPVHQRRQAAHPPWVAGCWPRWRGATRAEAPSRAVLTAFRGSVPLLRPGARWASGGDSSACRKQSDSKRPGSLTGSRGSRGRGTKRGSCAPHVSLWHTRTRSLALSAPGGPVQVWNPQSTSWTDACHRVSGDHGGEGVTRPERQRREGQRSREVAEVRAGAGPAQQTRVPSSALKAHPACHSGPAAGARRPAFHQDKRGGRGQPSFTLPWLERPWRWPGTFEAVVPGGAEEAGGVPAGGSSLAPMSCSTVS